MGEEEKKEEKRIIVPMVNISHNKEETGMNIQIDLAGAHKESLNLEVGKIGFCVKAEGEDFRYESCYRLGHEVKPEEAKAKFDSGLLMIQVPFAELLKGYKVDIEII